MFRTAPVWSLICGALLCCSASAQKVLPAPLPARGPAPLLHVRFPKPKGLKVSLYQGRPFAQVVKAGEQIGLRPGYIYRLEVTGFPERPGLTLYPTLEVYGTLHLAPSIPTSQFPVSLRFNEIDIERVLRGSLLTKVYYLEDPRKAVKEQGDRDLPFEIELPATRNLFQESFKRGRPMMIFRLGNRTWTPAEMAQQSIAGTVLFPGQKSLAIPAYRPQLRWCSVPLYDPILGPKKFTEECLVDGGDTGIPLGFRKGVLGGLDPEDTVAEYRNSTGRKKLTISNRVCVCVPRFGALRSETPIVAINGARRVELTKDTKAPGLMKREVPSLETFNYDQLLAFRGQRSVTEAKVTKQTSIVGKVEGLITVSANARLADITGTCKEPPRIIEKPLLLRKWANKKAAKIGDLVTFSLRFSNQGGKPISDIVISDSLTARLEYVPGTARVSRNARFTMQGNEQGSMILRWEVNGKLEPGEMGLITFQARVR